MKIRKFWLWVVIILLVGLGLRLFQLGSDSFWFDEAGVADAASNPSLASTLVKAADHAVAMPLDYVIAWGMARVSLDEGWMRLPSVFWGTLTLLVCAGFFRELVGERSALIGLSLLALSPMHIYYSQELRFYSSLVFFYILLTFCLLRALQQPGLKRWVLVVLVSTLGAYFHIYVLLAWLNGGLWLVWKAVNIKEPLQAWKGFLLSGIVSAVLVLPGFVIFGSESAFSYELSYDFLAGYIMAGLGWFPNYASRPGFVLGFLCLILYFSALWTALRTRQRPLLILVLSTIIQIWLIILADVVTSYFFASRQFIMLLPFTYLMVGWVLNRVYERKQPLFKSRTNLNDQTNHEGIRRFHHALALAMVLTLVTVSVMTLSNDFNQQKNIGREISQVLHEEWQVGDVVWVIPDWEPLLYQFYLEKRFGDPRLTDVFIGITWDQLSMIPAKGNGFLITQPLQTYDQYEMIKTLGFIPHTQLGSLDSGTQILWVRR